MTDLNKLTETNQGNPQLESINSGNTTKEELVIGLSEDKLECPYPEDSLYLEVRNKYTNQPDQQKLMMENIGPMIDGKREIIKMKKKFSQLTAKHNGKDIFKGEHEDKYGEKGIAGVTYLTGKAAEAECEKQGKKLLKNQTEVEQFISFFPGENTEEKIFNIVKLFNLEKSGHWVPDTEMWSIYNAVGSVGYVGLSGEDEDHDVYGLKWRIGSAEVYRNDQKLLMPFLVYDC